MDLLSPRLSIICGVALLSSACVVDTRPQNSTDTNGPTSDSGTDLDEGGEDESGEESDSGMMMKFDTGEGNTAGTGDGEPGCQKVDFLFVIDNSGSMGDEQDNLVQSFPGFIQEIQTKLEDAQDYHIMVVDTDEWIWGGCELLCGFGGFCLGNPEYQCGGGTQPEECEDVLGAGITHPTGIDSSNTDCNFASGGRYIDQSEPNLTGAFSCAARVGTGSTQDPERPMEAMVAATSPNGDVGACNEGFIRDDAILVVTFITDEDDGENDSAGTPVGWKAALVAAKKGDENAIVVLGVYGDNDQPNAICAPFDPDASNGAEPSPRLRQFVDSFGERGVSGSVCNNSYEDFFKSAVDIIDTTCDEFVPQG